MTIRVMKNKSLEIQKEKMDWHFSEALELLVELHQRVEFWKDLSFENILDETFRSLKEISYEIKNEKDEKQL